MGRQADGGRRRSAGIRRRTWAPVLFLAMATAGCAADELSVPPELLGTWTTDADKYRDRALQFTETSVLFHTGPGRFDVAGFGILDVRLDQDGTDPLYTVDYADHTGVTQLQVYLDRGASVLTLRNQPLVRWRRMPQEAPAPEPAGL